MASSKADILRANGIEVVLDKSWADLGLYVWAVVDPSRTKTLAHGTSASEDDANNALWDEASLIFPDAECFR